MVLIIASKIIQIRINTLKKTYKIQDGKVLYSDLDKPAKSFFSKKYRISGKPDYILKKNNRYLPVELKSGSHESPQKNHIFQLAAYCHLIEENFGVFVPYGILVYSDGKQFNIQFDPKIRFELEITIKEMRDIIKKGKLSKEFKSDFKCKNCSMKEYCRAF